jgi:hypothetical protein
MFPSFSKLALVVAVIIALWYALRWLNRAPTHLMRRRPAPSPPGPAQAAIEDLVACHTCGTYVAAGARACGRPGCPQPR